MTDIAAHYSRGDLLVAVLDAVRQAGFDPEHIDPEALAPFEEFHMFGRQGTVALAHAAAINAGDHVLDVGCGVCGPARLLALRYGARVTGLDLTPEFVEVANELNSRVGLADKVEAHQGDALAMPFPDGAFDGAWTQHVAMNIADKAGLYREMRRVTKPGGRLAVFDIVAGDEGAEGLPFPVPWATTPEQSHLVPTDDVVALIEATGAKVVVLDDLTVDAVPFFEAARSAPPSGPIGRHLLMGDTLVEKFANLRRGFEAGAVRVVRLVAQVPA